MRDDFKDALERAPRDINLRRIYADWLEEQGELAEARAQREIADELEPHDRERRPSGGREECDTTACSAVYRKICKRLFAGCDRCPWHDGDNRSRRPAHGSWKKSRKQRWRGA
jgi:uncharacterized protein (TIGR02996 family)